MRPRHAAAPTFTWTPVGRRAAHSRAGRAGIAGLVAAAAAGAIALAVLTWIGISAFRSGGSAPKPTGPRTLTDSKPSASDDLLGAGLELQLVDRKDPSRLAAELLLPSVEPLEAKRYAVQAPRVWLYLRNGLTVLITAERARLYLPSRTDLPEQGDFDGDVRIRVFRSRSAESGGPRLDPDVDPPLGVLSTPRMDFDGSLGQLRMPDRIVVTSESGLEYAGRDARVLVDDVNSRLQLLTVATTEYARYSPARAGLPLAASAAPSSSSSAAPATAAQVSEPLAAITFYRAQFGARPRLTQGDRSLAAASLELFAKLVDNELSLATAETSPVAERPKSSTADAANAVAASPTRAREPTPDTVESTIDLAWDGPLEIKPLDEAAGIVPDSLLAAETLALRFAGDAAGPVVFADTASHLQGHAPRVEYGVNTRSLRLVGSEGESVLLSAGDGRALQSLSARDVSVDLASSRATITGAALARTGDRNDSSVGMLAWSDGAVFDFYSDDAGRMTGNLRRLDVRGTVVAGGRTGVIAADRIEAGFTPARSEASRPPSVTVTSAPADTTRGESTLSWANATGSVRARDARDGRLAGDSLYVAFTVPPSGNPTATMLEAAGRVNAQDGTNQLEAGLLRVQLIPSESAVPADGIARAAVPASGVGAVIAVDDVIFSTPDLEARGDTLYADGLRGIAELSVELPGRMVTLGRAETYVMAKRVRVDAAARTLEAFGTGLFRHSSSPDGAASAVEALARWEDGLVVDDARGLVLVNGKAEVMAASDANTRDRLEAGAIQLQFSPGADERTAPRELLGLVAFGGTDNAGTQTPARLESRRYSLPLTEIEPEAEQSVGHPALDRLLYLQGDRVEAVACAQTLDVPGAGKLLLVDRRGHDPSGSDPARPAPTHSDARTTNTDINNSAASDDASLTANAQVAGPGTPVMDRAALARGTALFDWTGSMHLDRAALTGTLHGGVRLVHDRLQDRLLTELECEKLTAVLSPGASASATDDSQAAGDLARVTALGGVYARSGARELTAASVDYNPSAGTMEAASDGDDPVTYFDQATGTPQSARRVLWNLTTGRIEAREITPIVTPR